MEEQEERVITPLPKSLPIAAVVLFLLGIAAIPLVEQIFSEEQLSRNAVLSGIPFILIFASVILFFMSFIWFLANKLNFRVAPRTYQLIERLTIAGIVIGILMMFQPWVFVLFRYGFYLLLIATLAFIVWSHIVPKEEEAEQPAELSTSSE